MILMHRFAGYITSSLLYVGNFQFNTKKLFLTVLIRIITIHHHMIITVEGECDVGLL